MKKGYARRSKRRQAPSSQTSISITNAPASSGGSDIGMARAMTLRLSLVRFIYSLPPNLIRAYLSQSFDKLRGKQNIQPEFPPGRETVPGGSKKLSSGCLPMKSRCTGGDVLATAWRATRSRRCRFPKSTGAPALRPKRPEDGWLPPGQMCKARRRWSACRPKPKNHRPLLGLSPSARTHQNRKRIKPLTRHSLTFSIVLTPGHRFRREFHVSVMETAAPAGAAARIFIALEISPPWRDPSERSAGRRRARCIPSRSPYRFGT